MTDHYDALEIRDPAERERDLLAALPKHIAQAQTAAPAFAKILDGVKPADITTREALAKLPVTRKAELLELQKQRRADDPFGGFSAIGRGARMPRVFASPGTIYEPEGEARDYWRTARALHAAGFRGSELIHNSFSYHMTPAGSIMESGARALGCTVFAGGTGQTEQQLEAMADLKPEGYAGTPSFLKILLEKAEEKGLEAALAHQGAGVGRSLSAEPARLDRRAWRAGHPVLRHRRPGPGRLRDQRARRPGAR